MKIKKHNLETWSIADKLINIGFSSPDGSFDICLTSHIDDLIFTTNCDNESCIRFTGGEISISDSALLTKVTDSIAKHKNATNNHKEVPHDKTCTSNNQ